MILSGIQRFTMLDYPGKLSCIAFIPGCTIRCRYCHNPEFVVPELIQKIKKSFISVDSFMKFLKKRQGLLEAVTISGGEPTVMPDLPQFIKAIKELGFAVKLDTNGNNPRMLQKIIDETPVDYFAMDVKTSLEKYQDLVGGTIDPANIKKSIETIMDSGLEYEFRTTLIKEVHTPEIIQGIAKLITGARRYYLQEFRPGHTLDPLYSKYHPFSVEDMETLVKKYFVPLVKEVGIRSSQLATNNHKIITKSINEKIYA